MAHGHSLASESEGPRAGPGYGEMPRELCLSLGATALNCDTGAENMMDAPQKNLAPDASDAGFHVIVDFSDAVEGISRSMNICPALRWLADGRRRDNPTMDFFQT